MTAIANRKTGINMGLQAAADIAISFVGKELPEEHAKLIAAKILESKI